MEFDPGKVLNSIEQYVFCKDKLGVYTFANDPFSEIAGFNSGKEIIGKTDKELIWHEQADFYNSCDKSVLSGIPLLRDSQIQIRKEGPTKIIITKKPYLSRNGDIIGIIGNFFDADNTLVLETTGDFDENKGRLYLGFTNEWLSLSEIRICFYLIHGFSAPKISSKTNLSVSTVRFHIENIKSKMQCSNKNEITEKAMKTKIAWKILSLQHISSIDDKEA